MTGMYRPGGRAGGGIGEGLGIVLAEAAGRGNFRAPMPTDAILSTARQFLGVDPTVSITLEPIKRGASGRTILRVKTKGQQPFIGIHWTDEREDNEQFIPVGHFLKKCRLRVPGILFESLKRHVVLVEDLGDVDLLSLKDQPDVIAQVAHVLGKNQISIASLIQKEQNAGEQVPVVFLTHKALEKNFLAAMREIEALDVVAGKPVRMAIEDFD